MNSDEDVRQKTGSTHGMRDDKFNDKRERPAVLASEVHRVNTGYGNVYVHVGYDEDGDGDGCSWRGCNG